MYDVSLFLGSRRFTGWESLTLTRQIDTVDACSFVAPFNPDSDDQRAQFRPFTYPDASLSIANQDIFTGTAVNFVPASAPDRVSITVSCYGLPGVLQDCSAGATSLPVEFLKLNVRQIAEQVLEPFGIGVSFEGPIGGTFEKVALNPSEKVLSFLAKLARDRGLYITNTPTGDLLFTSADSADPVPRAVLTDTQQPVISVTPSFSPQEYFSEITGLVKAKKVRAGSKFTAQNPHLRSPFRPLMYELQDVDPADAEVATRAKLGRMFGNAAAYDVELATIFDQAGNIWAPNTMIDLTAPRSMIYQKTRFLIRSATLNLTASEQKATLKLALPEAFTGKAPGSLPWAG
jgi:prophage tail gpP-like protein